MFILLCRIYWVFGNVFKRNGVFFFDDCGIWNGFGVVLLMMYFIEMEICEYKLVLLKND